MTSTTFDKRLTDAELAAEYWRHDGDFHLLCEGNRVDTYGAEAIRPGFDTETRMQDQLATLHRFATLPHAATKD